MSAAAASLAKALNVHLLWFLPLRLSINRSNFISAAPFIQVSAGQSASQSTDKLIIRQNLVCKMVLIRIYR